MGRPRIRAEAIWGRLAASSVARLGSRTGVRSPHLASLRPCEAGPDRLRGVVKHARKPGEGHGTRTSSPSRAPSSRIPPHLPARVRSCPRYARTTANSPVVGRESAREAHRTRALRHARLTHVRRLRHDFLTLLSRRTLPERPALHGQRLMGDLSQPGSPISREATAFPLQDLEATAGRATDARLPPPLRQKQIVLRAGPVRADLQLCRGAMLAGRGDRVAAGGEFGGEGARAVGVDLR
jgi:hypothetical protein